MTQTEWKTRSGGFAARRSAAVGELPRSLGRWELVTLAAEGNWSQIYRARPLGSSPQRQAAYALKTLRPQASRTPGRPPCWPGRQGPAAASPIRT